jgi:hypothetical protein
MISIVSGPSCVGKSYFLKNKRERLLEIESIEYHHTEVVNWVEFPLGNILDNTWEDGRKEGKWLDYLLLKVNPVSAIILGVPYSEYKVRIELRRERNPSRSRPPLLYNPDVPVNRYKDWINELNKNEIPYVFVEAIGDYKVLEEEEFFRMLND